MGRVGELAELELAWREAAERRPVLVLLGADSGVGKTRIVGELEHRLTGPGALVLRGEGVDEGETELPYAPLLSALRPLVRERDPVLEFAQLGIAQPACGVLPGLDGGGTPAVASGSGDGSASLRSRRCSSCSIA